MARKSLKFYCASVLPLYRYVEWQVYLADRLDELRVGRDSIGPFRFLFLSVPPQHGKSTVATVCNTAFCLGVNPDERIVLTAATGDLAEQFSRQAKEQVKSPRYDRVFGLGSTVDRPVFVDSSFGSAKDWSIKGARGGVRATGVHGNISGYPADYMVIDDPHPGLSDMMSQTKRARFRGWLETSALARLHNESRLSVVHTRWHSEDAIGLLTGWLDPRQYRYYRLPAIAEEDDPLGRKPGEALWPERHSVERLLAARKRSPRLFESIYQQKPPTGLGILLEEQDIVISDIMLAPDDARRVRAWDTALTSKELASDRTSWTVGTRMAGWRARLGDAYYQIEDVQRVQKSPTNVRKHVARVARMDGPSVVIVVELAGGGRELVDDLRRDRDLAGYTIVGHEPIEGDKIARANHYIDRVSTGVISLLRAPWNGDWIAEHINLPAWPWDDQLDSGNAAYLTLAGYLSTGSPVLLSPGAKQFEDITSL